MTSDTIALIALLAFITGCASCAAILTIAADITRHDAALWLRTQIKRWKR